MDIKDIKNIPPNKPSNNPTKTLKAIKKIIELEHKEDRFPTIIIIIIFLIFSSSIFLIKFGMVYLWYSIIFLASILVIYILHTFNKLFKKIDKKPKDEYSDLRGMLKKYTNMTDKEIEQSVDSKKLDKYK